jgi:asparagine synthase (glutamine-hydrolysing)
MSGICGIALQYRGREVECGQLSPMVEALAPLPCDKGATVFLGHVGLGVAPFPGRLAGVCIEWVNGQPLGLAVHGSFFNLSEIIGEAGDPREQTKLLLSLYQKQGIGFVEHLRGEFVLVVWNGSEETLSIVTDRFRVHPLFYYQDPEKFVFASSMKALTACPLEITRSIKPSALVTMVASYMIPTPHTIFNEIKKMPPGSYLVMKQGYVTVKPYWDVQFSGASTFSKKNMAEALRRQFDEAVSVRLAIDVPPSRIGTFLSGGVDSSTVTGVVTKLLKNPVSSFSIGFQEKRFNEMEYARIAAKAFGAHHYEYFVSPEDTVSAIPILVEAFDEPYGNSSAVPAYFCAKLAKEHGIESLYAGDAGDELFVGNKRYATQKLFDYYFSVPAWMRRFLIEPLFFGVGSRIPVPLFDKGKRYIQRANAGYPARLCAHGLYEVIPLVELFDDGILEAIGKDYNPDFAVYEHYNRASATSELDRQLYIDLKLIITDNDLIKVVKTTEAAGITVRFPFIDHRFVEFAASVPSALKMRGLRLRSFFKDAYSDLLPPEIRRKTKQGFGLPIPIWLRHHNGLNEMMRDLVLSPKSVQRGYFKKKMLEDIVERHKTDSTSFYGTVLWNLMMLELWHRRYWN